MPDSREVLDQIAAAHGGELTAAMVLKAATPVGHPLHDSFEWDDSVAGHRFRLIQAARIIRIVREPYIDRNGEQRTVRAYLPVTITRGPDPDGDDPLAATRRIYMSTRAVVADQVLRESTLTAMRAEWESYRRRYQHLEEFTAFVAGELAI